MLEAMQRYMKFAAQVVMTAAVVLVAALQDNRVDAAEWINVLIAAASAIAVLGAGELSVGIWRYTKVGVAALLAGLMLLASFVSDGGVITGSEWLQVLIAAAGAIGLLPIKGPVLSAVGQHAYIGRHRDQTV